MTGAQALDVARPSAAISTVPPRVGIVADLLEEGWPSMDLVADMLMAHAGAGETRVDPVWMRPSFVADRRPGGSVPIGRRIFHRFWSYPRWLRAQAPADVYHIVDHSYAHLAADLPAARVVVTCHDTDAFRPLFAPGERESRLPRLLVKRIVAGLRRAAIVACDSEQTRNELVGHEILPATRCVVVPNGVHPACTASPDSAADAEVDALIGPARGVEILHVGSTIPRKRIELLLDVLAHVARSRPDVRLLRAGGPLTSAQAARARELGIEERITTLPFLSRPVLASLYRRAAIVVLPSAREGFGLPIIEAMACGTPVLCSDIPVLREVGGEAATFCSADVAAWSARILALLAEREREPLRWASRRAAGIAHASRFSWERYATAMQAIYAQLAGARRVTT